MKLTTKKRIRKNVTNLFGAFGYFFVALQWLMLVVVYFGFIKSLPMPSTDNQIEPQTVIFIPEASVNVPGMMFAGIVTIAAMALSIYVFIKMPLSMIKTGKKAVHVVAEETTPVVLRVQHKKDTKKNRKLLTLRVVLIMKIILILIPVGLSYASKYLKEPSLDFLSTMHVGLYLAGLSVLAFGLQYLFAKLLSVKITEAL